MKPLRLSVTSFAVIALAAGLLACTPLRASDSSKTPKTTADTLLPKDQRKAAPEFSLTDAEGKPIELAKYRGKVVLLDFWATWCGGCKLEIPWYMEFDTKYKRQGLAVIGVSMDEDGWKAVKPFLAKEYNLTSMPMTLLIDREGRIFLSHTGVVNKDDFEGHIRQLLQ
jgi:peroxiredoxin